MIRPSDPAPVRRVLVVESGNAAASQLATGLLRDRGRDRIVVTSAGAGDAIPDPLVARVLDELGIVPAAWAVTPAGDTATQTFDAILTICATNCVT